MTYRIVGRAADIERRAHAIAVEQSVEMPLEAVGDAWVRRHVVGRVERVRPVEGIPRTYLVTIALSPLTVGNNSAQLLSMVFGNVSLDREVELVDLVLPPSLLTSFAGPAFGIEGLRKLTGASERALTCTALKPQGASVAHLAHLCRQLAGAGIDVIKDDHGLADQVTSPFGERVKACQRAVAGTSSLYAPSIVGTPHRVAEHLEIARGEGVKVVLISPMIYGLAAFSELAVTNPDMAFVAHPAFAGTSRIAPDLLLGRLFRLYGADAVIFPNHGGRFAYSAAVCAALAASARQPWETVRPALPIPAGGMTVDRVGEMLQFYGSDVMLLISGDLLNNPSPERQAQRFADAVRAQR